MIGLKQRIFGTLRFFTWQKDLSVCGARKLLCAVRRATFDRGTSFMLAVSATGGARIRYPRHAPRAVDPQSALRLLKQKHHPAGGVFVLAGAEGLEPSARGFGDRCSTNCAIPLYGGPSGTRTRDHPVMSRVL